MRLPDFRLETHLARWEFTAEHHLTASDAEAMSMRELLAFGTAAQRDAFENLWLGYTETWGAPDLREAIAATYDTISANQVLGFAGASEGIFAANNVLLDAESHAVVVTPTTRATNHCPQPSATPPAFRSIPTTAGRSTSTVSPPRSARIPNSSRSISRTTRRERSSIGSATTP